ncbi:MAG: rod shape-determining protein MreC [Bacteroidales bacterium]|nr:rod shape-determining protein MreC [Bacteroidales bacterium]MCF8458068.1 rod shape-determining protein MreC [Bacteroidales bacterium]
MRELLRFIQRIHFLLLFLILEIIAFSFLVSENSYQRAKFFNSSRKVFGQVYHAYDKVAQYVSLKQKNEELVLENVKLHNHIPSLENSPSVFDGDSLAAKRFSYLSAKVINNSLYRRKNYLTIDKGSNSGVEPEMGVVSPTGLVGITRFTSSNFTSVVSLLNEEIRISTKIKKTGYFGPLAWTGADPTEAYLMEIPVHVNISVGDTLISSGYSAIFPEGILVGTIKEYKKKPGDNFYEIKVRLSVDYGRLGHVYVIDNKLRNEQLNLEEATAND